MKFPLSKGDFKGIINFLKQYNLPYPSINAVIDTSEKIDSQSIDAFVHHEPDTFIQYHKDGTDPIDLIFDFSISHVKITSYIIETANYGSPPTQWTISGSNDINGPWTTIDSPPFNNSLCPFSSVGTECRQRTITRWNCYSPSRYRYIRFSIISDRTQSQSNLYLRLGGIEFYGTLSLGVLFSCNNRYKNSFSCVSMILILLIYHI